MIDVVSSNVNRRAGAALCCSLGWFFVVIIVLFVVIIAPRDDVLTRSVRTTHRPTRNGPKSTLGFSPHINSAITMAVAGDK
jgi:hypothetical protein